MIAQNLGMDRRNLHLSTSLVHVLNALFRSELYLGVNPAAPSLLDQQRVFSAEAYLMPYKSSEVFRARHRHCVTRWAWIFMFFIWLTSNSDF